MSVVKISGDGDDGLRDFFAEVGLGSFFHLLQYECADLARAVFFASDLSPGIVIVPSDDLIRDHALVLGGHGIVEPAADESLDGKDRVVGVGDGLSFRRLSNKHTVIFGESHDRRRCSRSLGVFDDPRLLPVHHCDARIRRAEIDPDNFRHDNVPLMNRIISRRRCL